MSTRSGDAPVAETTTESPGTSRLRSPYRPDVETRLDEHARGVEPGRVAFDDGSFQGYASWYSFPDLVRERQRRTLDDREADVVPVKTAGRVRIDHARLGALGLGLDAIPERIGLGGVLGGCGREFSDDHRRERAF